MSTPRFRFSVAPFLMAFFVGLGLLPATHVVQVNARGMGAEHEQPWRQSSSVSGILLAAAGTILARLRQRFERVQRHALFRPAVACLALLVAVAVFGKAALYAAPFALGAILTEGTHAGEFLAYEVTPFFRETVTVLSGQNLKSGAVVGRVNRGIGRVSIPAVVGTGTGTASAVFAGPEVEVGSYIVKCITAVANGGVFSVTTPSGKRLPNLTLTVGSGGATAYVSRHLNFTITDATDFAVDDTFTFVVDTTAPTVIGGTGTGTMTLLSLGPDAKPGNYRVTNRAVVANGGDFEVIGPDGASVGRFLMGTGSAATAAFASRQINFSLTDNADFILGNYFDIAVFNQLGGGKVVAWDPQTFDGRQKAVGVLLAGVDASLGDAGGVLIAREAVVLKGALQWGAAITAGQYESAYRDLAERHIIARDSVA